ncbi:unnamed protein product [Spirodela intermedia]|uniref:Uncharacterized protein n=1 Tax=Spirodela intermedia TaxID=51605 RepID=A0A7I8JI56_SPIIN|nr:unnamed protein product [Spirodela intermedia]CAA6669828.1 unnamed protein product [Spirodela intermedia]
MDIPKIPAKIAGTIRELHPLAVAIPQAVVGPPTLALEANTRWTTNCTKANAKTPGVVFITFHMLPFAPTTAKNTCPQL